MDEAEEGEGNDSRRMVAMVTWNGKSGLMNYISKDIYIQKLHHM